MIGYVLLAFFNGWLVGASRVVNGRLAVSTSAAIASLWNNLTAFIFMAALLVPVQLPTLEQIGAAHPIVYLGGVLGAFFVVVNSFVLPKLGTSVALALVIAGQMIGGVLIDFVRTGSLPTLFQASALVLIAVGAGGARLAGKYPRLRKRRE